MSDLIKPKSIIAIDEKFRSTTELTINKSINTVENIADNFINGISAKALICLILGGLILGASIIWSIIGYILNTIWNSLFGNKKKPEPDDETETDDGTSVGGKGQGSQEIKINFEDDSGSQKTLIIRAEE